MKKPRNSKPIWMKTTDIAAIFDVSRTAVQDWIKKGVPVNGRIIKLRALMVGCALRIKRRWLREFIADCNPQAPPAPVSKRRVSDDYEKATADLRAMGVRV